MNEFSWASEWVSEWNVWSISACRLYARSHSSRTYITWTKCRTNKMTRKTPLENYHFFFPFNCFSTTFGMFKTLDLTKNVQYGIWLSPNFSQRFKNGRTVLKFVSFDCYLPILQPSLRPRYTPLPSPPPHRTCCIDLPYAQC